MRSFVSLAAGSDHGAFAAGSLVVLIASETTSETCRAIGAAIRSAAQRMEGRPYALLIDYHGPLAIPSAETRREVANVVRASKDVPAAARAVVLRGNGLREQTMRAFFRWTLSLMSFTRTPPECPAEDVPSALAFLSAHVPDVPTLSELRPIFTTEYARLGLGDPGFGDAWLDGNEAPRIPS